MALCPDSSPRVAATTPGSLHSQPLYSEHKLAPSPTFLFLPSYLRLFTYHAILILILILIARCNKITFASFKLFKSCIPSCPLPSFSRSLWAQLPMLPNLPMSILFTRAVPSLFSSPLALGPIPCLHLLSAR